MFSAVPPFSCRGAGVYTNGAIVSGFGDGSRNSGFIPGQSGGTNYPALLLASAGGIVSASTVGFGGVGMAVYNGTVMGGTAFDSGSFVAANGGVVSGVDIGSNGGLLASTVSGEGGGAGLVLNAHVHSGGYALAGGGFTIKGQDFAGKGVISNGTFDVGSTEILVSGGSDLGSIFAGTQIVGSSGWTTSNIFSAGTQMISSGGIATSSVVSAGGRIEIYSGGSANTVTVGSAGSLHVYNAGRVDAMKVQSAGEASAEAGGVISNPTVSAGGTLTLESGATLISGTIIGTTADGSYGGLLVVHSGAVLSGSLTMGWKSRLDINSLRYDPTYQVTATSTTVTIKDASGKVIWSGNILPWQGVGYHLEEDPNDGSTYLVYDKCFLKGTMIRTANGDTAVEDLVVGDRVIALVDGHEVMREIIWTGHRSTATRPGLHDDEAGYPVRIRRHALGENVPNKDLLVTPEHAMFLDGAFVPVRMLVNGRSIFYDRTITHFDYYHIETDEHSIIWSDGALSESYLDTGDRAIFSSNSSIVHLLNAPASDWDRDAAAPLRVDRAFAEPLHVRLMERARALNLESVLPPVPTTNDPDLCLIDPAGQVFRALRTVNLSYIFMVPADIGEVRIVSRTARPVDMIGPFLDDRRHLGVLVGKIQVWEAEKTHSIDVHFATDELPGWANRENGEHRWTTGDAVLPLADLRPGEVVMLSIEILAGGPYPEESTALNRQLAAG